MNTKRLIGPLAALLLAACAARQSVSPRPAVEETPPVAPPFVL